MSTFPGTSALINQLSPVSLAQRKQQLVNSMVTGNNQRHTVFPGGGSPIAPGMGMRNPFAASLFSAGYANDPNGQFYGGGGPPTAGPVPPPRPVDIPMPSSVNNVTTSPVSIGPNGNGSAVASMGSGLPGGLNPYSSIDPNVLQSILAGSIVSGSGGRLTQ